MDKPTLSIDIEIDNTPNNDYPSKQDICGWVEAVMQSRIQCASLAIRIIDRTEMQSLNHQYRGKNMPTNVLAFPAPILPDIRDHIPLLGDIALCADVIIDEAQAQQKSPEAHWAHMVIHGCLHLLGFDHIELQKAQIMESEEIHILSQLGYHNPYEENA